MIAIHTGINKEYKTIGYEYRKYSAEGQKEFNLPKLNFLIFQLSKFWLEVSW
jgi:hypothetical protein